jgi:hypothetical protein
MGKRIGRVEGGVGDFRRIVTADQRRQQALRRVHVVEAEAALDAQALAVGRTIAAGDGDDLLLAHLIVDLAADAAVRADAGHDAVDRLPRREQAAAVCGQHRRRHQRAGRAGLHALAAADAARIAHGIVEIEDDFRRRATTGHADDVVGLDVAASLHAQLAVDAGVEVHAHRRVAAVGEGGGRCAGHGGARRETAVLQAQLLGPVPERRVAIVRLRAWRLLGEQQFDHQPPAVQRAFGSVAAHLHAGADLASATRRQVALAVDLDHARPAVAARPIVRRLARA